MMRLQALLGQLFPSERAASMAAAAAAVPGPKPVTRKAAEDPRKPETRHSEFKGVHWSVREQTWRAILLHDDKVQIYCHLPHSGVRSCLSQGVWDWGFGDTMQCRQDLWPCQGPCTVKS